MPKNNGGSAFPIALGWIESDMNSGAQTVVDVRDVSHGMSLRDYFAAKALPLVAPRFERFEEGDPKEVGYLGPDAFGPVARAAYGLADAMLAARGDS